MKFVRHILLVTACLFIPALRAGEMKGTVKSVTGDSALVAMEGDVMPPNGAKAEYFFRLGGDEVSVATGTALHIDRGQLRVSIENATGAVEAGHLVRFPGTTGPASANTPSSSANAPPPIAATAPSPAPADANADPFRIVPNDSPAYPYLSRAADQYNAKDVTAAIATLSEGIRAAPSAGELYLLRGNLYLMKAKWKGATADAKKALDLNTTKPHIAYLILGTAKGEQGNYKAGIAELNKAIEAKPDFSSAYNNRSNYRFATRDYHGALADSSKSIQLQPDLPEAYVNRGWTYGILGDYSKAIDDLRRAIELDSSRAKDLNPKIREFEKKGGKATKKKKPEADVDDL